MWLKSEKTAGSGALASTELPISGGSGIEMRISSRQAGLPPARVAAVVASSGERSGFGHLRASDEKCPTRVRFQGRCVLQVVLCDDDASIEHGYWGCWKGRRANEGGKWWSLSSRPLLGPFSSNGSQDDWNCDCIEVSRSRLERAFSVVSRMEGC